MSVQKELASWTLDITKVCVVIKLIKLFYPTRPFPVAVMWDVGGGKSVSVP